MPPHLSQESLFIPVNDTDTLHLQRFYKKEEGEPVFMLHGSIENGGIFYSNTGKGLAPYLAEHGYDVYVADLRGRGLSTPPIGRHSRYGQTEAITEDIPAFIKAIEDKRGEVPQHWVAHSWGGVLMASFLARFPQYLPRVKTMIYFASKRSIRVRHLKKFFVMDLFWNQVSRLMIQLLGYLPTKQLGVGSDNETDKSHLHCKLWALSNSKWIDPEDHFDYGEAIKKISLPPTLHFAGVGDAYLGNPSDVKDFMAETGAKIVEYVLLSRKTGNLHDYGHVDILTHPDATRDHFPRVLDWMKAR